MVTNMEASTETNKTSKATPKASANAPSKTGGIKFSNLYGNIDSSTPSVLYRNIEKTYDDGTQAIKQLSLTIDQGEFVMLVGSSGGGKTTLLKMANGLIEPTSGTIEVFGHNIKDYDIINLRRHIGYAIQGSVLFPHLNVASNIAYTMNLDKVDKEEIKKRVVYLIEMVGLDTSMLKKYPNELSGGQQQRVGIARALANYPKLLLMDEPFGAVDSITRSSLQNEMQRIFKETGVSILFVTHDINEAMKLGTKIAVIDSGTLQQYDSPENILNNPATKYVEKLCEGCHLE